MECCLPSKRSRKTLFMTLRLIIGLFLANGYKNLFLKKYYVKPSKRESMLAHVLYPRYHGNLGTRTSGLA
jgi:hypothetical protein